MKKNIFISVALILIALGSYYYGAQRGTKATTDIITLQLGMKAVDQMVMNSALLLSIKNEKPEMTLQIAQQLVEHDVKHLDKIEMMLEEIPLDEFDKNIFRVSIVEARENHKLVNDL
jgi:uncharacterized membrane protein YjjP (DUF1212 family)